MKEKLRSTAWLARRAKKSFLSFAICAMAPAMSFAADPIEPKSAYPTEAAIDRELVVENVYRIKIRKYSPAVQVQFIDQEGKASQKTPEDALVSHLSAMKALNPEWFDRTWTEESRKANEDRDRKEKRPPEFWKDVWRKVLERRRVQMVNRIESGKFVMVQYQLVSNLEGEVVFDDTVVLVQEGGKWLLTQELSADPVPTFWQGPEYRMRKIVR